jgi:hypothetical protein
MGEPSRAAAKHSAPPFVLPAAPARIPRHHDPFPERRRRGNVAFPAFRPAGEQGTPPSLFFSAQESREEDLPSSPEDLKSGERRVPCSSGDEKRREDRLPSFPVRRRSGKTLFPPLRTTSKGGKAPFPPLPRPGKQGRPRSLLFRAQEQSDVSPHNLVGWRREEGRPSSLLSGGWERREDGVPCSPKRGKSLLQRRRSFSGPGEV